MSITDGASPLKSTARTMNQIAMRMLSGLCMSLSIGSASADWLGDVTDGIQEASGVIDQAKQVLSPDEEPEQIGRSTPASSPSARVEEPGQNRTTRTTGKALETEGYIVLESPDSTMLRPLRYQSHRGTFRFGVYREVEPTPDYNEQTIRLNEFAFATLMKLKELGDVPAEAMKAKFHKRSDQSDPGVPDHRWYATVKQLAAIILTEKGYETYLCPEDRCSSAQRRYRISPGDSGAWGGANADEFEARTAFHAFMDNQWHKIQAYVDQLPDTVEAYMVGPTQISPYNFDQGAFFFKITAMAPPLNVKEGLDDHPAFQPQVFSENKFSRMRGHPLAMPVDEAESFAGRTENQELYAVYKVRLSPVQASSLNSRSDFPFKTVEYTQELISDGFDVYMGRDLDESLVEVPFPD